MTGTRITALCHHLQTCQYFYTRHKSFSNSGRRFLYYLYYSQTKYNCNEDNKVNKIKTIFRQSFVKIIHHT